MLLLRYQPQEATEPYASTEATFEGSLTEKIEWQREAEICAMTHPLDLRDKLPQTRCKPGVSGTANDESCKSHGFRLAGLLCTVVLLPQL